MSENFVNYYFLFCCSMSKSLNLSFQVARRFIASVVRIFVILAIEMMPNAGKKKPGSSYTQSLAKCIKVRITMCYLCV